MKTCTKCKISKEATKEFFQADKRGRDGLNATCKDCANKKAREWKANHPERARERQKSYVTKRKDKMRAYARHRYATDPFTRARNNIKNRIYEVMETEQYSTTLGCSGTKLKRHLESLFQPGMTWENYGEWHIDHKTPLSVSYAQGPGSFKKACHYTNLQPLWAIDNLRKSNKV